MHNIFTMMSSWRLLHLIIIVISALLGVFEWNQSMAVFPRCIGIRTHAWFPVNWAAVAMVMAVLITSMKIGNLMVNTKGVLAQWITFLFSPGNKFYGIWNIQVSYCIKPVQYQFDLIYENSSLICTLLLSGNVIFHIMNVNIFYSRFFFAMKFSFKWCYFNFKSFKMMR